MANTKISALNSLTKATLATNDVFPVVDTGSTETKKITYQELIQPTDANFRIAGSADNTKLVAFEVDGLTTATTRTITIPDANTTLVGTDATQTLTNKTLTAPQINMGSDATGDIYYRTAGGAFARLPIGTSGQIMQTSSSGIPEWIANPSVSDASTTVKGVVEEATQAEVLARTSAGGTSARLFVNPSTLTTVKTYDYAVDSGSSTAYAIAPTPAITAYVTGQNFTFKATNANTTTTPTLNVSTIGAKTIINPDGSALVVGQIAANSIVTCVYDGTNMQLMSIKGSAPVTSTKIANTYTDVTPAADTAENTIYTTSIPANTLGTNNAVRLKIYFDTFTMTNNGTFTIRCKYGSTTVATLTVAAVTVTAAKGSLEFILMGSGATTTQEGTAHLLCTPEGVGTTSVVVNYLSTGTAAETSTGALNLVVTTQAQFTGGLSGTLTLRAATLEKLY